MKVATTCWEQLLVILYVVLRHAAKISRGFLPDFFQFCRRQKGDQKWRPKLGSVKLNFSFGGAVLGSTFGPCFQFPQVSQKCTNCWTRPTVTSRHSVPSSRFEMQLPISYCCFPAPCSYDGIKRRHHIGTHSKYIYIYIHICINLPCASSCHKLGWVVLFFFSFLSFLIILILIAILLQPFSAHPWVLFRKICDVHWSKCFDVTDSIRDNDSIFKNRLWSIDN